MHIQGIKLKKGKKLQKGVLYEFVDSRTITFTEQETRDVVDVVYQLEGNEKGYFSQEYRQNTVAKEGAKAVDITACIIDEKAGVCCWWLYDVKKDVGGQHVISHLCGQWQAAYSYLANSVLNILVDKSIKLQGSIGVITRNFDTDRIRSEFEKLDRTIKEMEKDDRQKVTLAKRKAGVELPALRKKRDLLKDILCKKVRFRCSGKDMEMPFDVKISEERNRDEYYCQLICESATSVRA